MTRDTCVLPGQLWGMPMASDCATPDVLRYVVDQQRLHAVTHATPIASV